MTDVVTAIDSGGIVQARTTGRLALRLANASVLPLEFTNVADTVGRYVKELQKLAETKRTAADESARRARERIDLLAAASRYPYFPKPADEPVPYLNLAPLENAVARLDRAAREFDRNAVSSAPALDASRRAALDAVLLRAEHSFTRTEGLPRRPWFRHQIYAPGWYTGYGVKTLPAVREAIEQKRFDEIDPAVRAAASAIEAYAAEVERAASLGHGGTAPAAP